MSASLPGSSIWLIETSTSGGIFLLSLMYCSNCATTVRASASISCCASALLADQRSACGLEERLVVGRSAAMRARWPPSTSTLTVPSGSFSSCSTVPTVPTVKMSAGRRIVLRRVLLGDEEDLLIVLHHVLERAHRFLAPDEQRHDHVRETPRCRAAAEPDRAQPRAVFEHEALFQPGIVRAAPGQDGHE